VWPAAAWAILFVHDAIPIAAGASGGIFGLFGAQVALWLRLRKHLPPELKRAGLRTLLINVVLNVFIALQFPVDTAAHVGGLLTGFLLALLVPIRRMPERPWQKPAQWLVVACAFVLFSLEGAAVARAVKPHDRKLAGAGTHATLPWSLVQLHSFGAETPAANEALAVSPIGLVASLKRVDGPLEPAHGEITLGVHVWQRDSESTITTAAP